MADDAPGMVVEVCWVAGEEVLCWRLHLPAGSSVADVLSHDALVQPVQQFLLGRWQQLTELGWVVAINGRTVLFDQVLDTGDRVDVLGPLMVDPKEARHRRVAVARQVKQRTRAG